MELKIFPYGPLSSNMYLLSTGSGIFLIDPSVYPEDLKKDDLPQKLDYILITHSHFDHINALDKWCEAYPEAEVYMSKDDIDGLSDPDFNCSSFFAELCRYKCVPKDVSELKLEGITVIKTPGHSKGSVCFLFEKEGEKLMFTGDTLFAGSCGRSDFKGGSSLELMASLKKLSLLDRDIKIFPGHGPSSTIENEHKTNPFFNY